MSEHTTPPANTIPCTRCRLAFKGTPRQRASHEAGRPVYCSRDCQKGANLVSTTCAGCGVALQRRKTDIGSTGRAFCSKECRNAIGSKPRTGRTIACLNCGGAMWVKPYEAEIKTTCSRACKDAYATRGRITRACDQCGEEYTRPPSVMGRFCSRDCAETYRTENAVGHINKDGYRIIHVDGKQMGEHRHVMEQILGRPLAPWETVHHKTGGFDGRSDNRPENLEHWVSRHPRGHRIEDVVRYAREMLSVYGDDAERARYADLAAPVMAEKRSADEDPNE